MVNKNEDKKTVDKVQEKEAKIISESSPEYQLQDGPAEVKVEQKFDKHGRLIQPDDVKQPLKVGPDATDKEQHEKAEKAGTSGVQGRNQGG